MSAARKSPFAYRSRNRAGRLNCWICPTHRWTFEGLLRHLEKAHGRSYRGDTAA